MGLLLACLLALALPAPAMAAVNVTAFSVTSTTTQAGGHPDLTVSTSFDSSPDSDDVKDLTVRFPPGLLGNPTATSKCTQAQFAADTCPGGTTLGSVAVTADATIGLTTFSDVVSQGTVYNLQPMGAEPARLGIKVRPAPPAPGITIEKISLIAVAKLGPDTGYALETTIPNQPRTANSSAGPVALRVTKVDLTLRGNAGGKDFMINPSSCAASMAITTAVPYDSGSPSSRSAPYTATNCPGLAFGPLVSGTIGARRANRAGQNVQLTSVINFPAGASLRDTVVLLPTDVGSDVNSIGRACPVATPIAACPTSSHIGSAEADSLLLETPLKGPLVLKASATSALPSLVVDLKGAAPLTLFGKPDFVGNRVRNTFPGAPDVPLSKFTLRVNGGKGGLLLAAQDLCRPDKKQILDARLTGWNGKVVSRRVALKPQGCKGYRPPKPKATVSLRRRALSVKVTAGEYTKLRSVRVTLPKGVNVRRLRGRARTKLKVRISRGRVLRVTLSRRGSTTLRLSSRRLTVPRGLVGRRVRVRVAAKDSTKRTVRLRVRTRVRR